MGKGIRNLMEMMKDEAFYWELESAGSKEDLRAMLKDKVEGLTEKELDLLLNKDTEALSDDDLKEIAGGKGNTPANSSEKTIKETVKKLKQLV